MSLLIQRPTIIRRSDVRATTPRPIMEIRIPLLGVAILVLTVQSVSTAYNAPSDSDPWSEARKFKPIDYMVDITNYLGMNVLYEHNFLNDNNIAFSPYGLTGIMIALYEGIDGVSSIQIKESMGLPNDRNIMRVGFRDIHRRLRSYFIPKEGFLAGLAFNNENVTFKDDYKSVLNFYGYDFEMPKPLTTETVPSSTERASTPMNSAITAAPTNPIKESTTTERNNMAGDGLSSTVSLLSQTSEDKDVSSTLAQTSQTTERPTTKIETSTLPMTVPVTDVPSTTTQTSTQPTTSKLTTTQAATTVPPATTPTTTQATTTTTKPTTTQATTTTTKPTTTTQTTTMPTTTVPTTTPTTTVPTTTPLPTTRTTTTQATTTAPTTTMASTTMKLPPQTTVTVVTTTANPTTTQLTETTNTRTTRSTAAQTTTVRQQTTNAMMDDAGSTLSDRKQSEMLIMSDDMDVTTVGSVDSTTAKLTTAQVTESSTLPSTTDGKTTKKRNDKTTTDGDAEEESTSEPPKDMTTVEGMESTTAIAETTESDPTTMGDFSDMTTVISYGSTTATEKPLQRKKKSIFQYEFASPPYQDHFAFYRPTFLRNPNYEGRGLHHQRSFLANGYSKVQITYMTYDTVLEFAYIPHLKCLALKLPLDTSEYYLLILLPEYEFGVNQLVKDLHSSRSPSLKQINYMLANTYVRAWVPSFMLKGFVVLTSDLQKLGICDAFEPRQDDFKPMTNEKNIYVRNIEQAITVTIRKYMEPGVKKRYVQNQAPVDFAATHPFLFFVMDSAIHVSLMAGKIVNPLNSRIL